MSVVSRAPEAVVPRPRVLHRSIQVTAHGADGAIEWRRRHARALLLGDLCVLTLALGTAQVIRFGSTAAPQVDGLGASYPALGLVLAVVWWASLQIHQSRSPLVVGHGPEEYRRVIVATFRVFAVMAMLSLALQIEASRIYLAVRVPAGPCRAAGRAQARSRGPAPRPHPRGRDDEGARRRRRALRRPAHPLVRQAPHRRIRGRRRVGPGRTHAASRAMDGFVGHIPVMSASLDFAEALAVSEAGAVVVTDTEHLGHESLRDLTWQLEGTGVELMHLAQRARRVRRPPAPQRRLGHADASPAASRSTPVPADRQARLRLRWRRLILAAAAHPLLLATASPSSWTQPGTGLLPRRSGSVADRAPFRMTKFRSMRVDAEQRAAKAARAQRSPTRCCSRCDRTRAITRVGRVHPPLLARRAPAAAQRARGEMSLVGPRPLAACRGGAVRPRRMRPADDVDPA